MDKNKKKNIVLVAITVFIAILSGLSFYSMNKDNETDEVIQNAVNEIKDYITTYSMTKEEIEKLPSTEIIEQTQEQEKIVGKEQEVENEGFELQGDIAYEGDRANTWDIELGDYKGLTYYSQIDSRWKNKMYSSVGDKSQTIGTSGCGPTSAAMIVTATKGAITPDTMSDLFVKYGYRSANSGTYWSAFRAVADEFNIGYTETTDIQKALQLLANYNYVVVSVGNGLFTTGGHFIVLTELNGDTITVYDPYLYAGKFDTSTRRGKVTVDGNKVYVSVSNFINYANSKGFFCYEHDGTATENIVNVTTGSYTRYVTTNSKNLNVRSGAGYYSIIGSLRKGTAVTVAETSGNWSRITSPVNGWVSSSYLSASPVSTVTTITGYKTGKYKVTRVSKNSVLCVRTGPSTKYSKKTYRQLSTNARSQNSINGNYYANGYKNNVVFTVSRISANWGLTPSGWVCLDYCSKIS